MTSEVSPPPTPGIDQRGDCRVLILRFHVSVPGMDGLTYDKLDI